MHNKATIGTTIIWIISTLAIFFVALIVLSLVFMLANRFGGNGFGDPYIMPEKADVLYGALNTKIAGDRVDNLIARDKLSYAQIQGLMGNINSNQKSNWFLSIEKDQDKTSVNDLLENKYKFAFPILSQNKLNFVIDNGY